MIDLRVKTLDSRNHEFSVPDNFTVKQLKEHIAETVNLPAESQRLIYCGRVLQDDKNLSEYDVNGKVIHLVHRAPPVSNAGGTDNTTSANPPRRNQTWRTIFQPGGNQGNAMYLGAMAFPADLMDAQGISMPQPRQCLSQSRLAVAQGMLRKATNTLNRLENPTPSTNGASPPGSSADISPDPNSNTNVNEDLASIALAVQAAAAAAQATLNGSEATASATAGTGAEEQPAQTANGNNNSTGSRSQIPRTTALADLLDQLSEVNTRLQPHLAQYHQLMREDPTLPTWESQQRIFGGVSEIMHFLSHAYHALSDIMCDFSLPPPRFLRCRPVLIQHSAVLQTGIPIQAQINLTSNTSNAQAQAPASETPATSTDTSTTNSNTQPLPPPPLPRAQGGRTLNLPSGIEVFMDVSPGAITIDSLEATVVTNSLGSMNSVPRTEANTTGSFPLGPAPTQDFIQNLLQTLASQIQSNQIIDGTNAVVEQMRNIGALATTAQSSSTTTSAQSAGQNSRARGNTATRPTTATQTRSTARPHVHLTPAIQSLGASNFDPFLPCNSHHIRSSRRRTSQQPASAASQTSAQQQTGNLNASRESEQSNRANSPVIMFPVSNEETITTRNIDGASPPASPAPLFLPEEERNLPMSLFTQLIQRISGGDTRPTSTISQFLQTLPDYSYNEGENLFMDIFMTLAESFTFMDLMDLRLGRSECLLRVIPQLRRLMSQRLLRNEPANENSINAVVSRFNAELRPFYYILQQTRLRDEVDLIATINLYNTTMLPRILEAIFLEQDENTYRSVVLYNCRLYVYNLCAILQYCCLEGNNGLEGIIRNVLCHMTTDLPSALQTWTVSSSVVNFRHFIENLSIPVEEIRPYLVYRIGQGGQAPEQVQIQEPMETETEATVTSTVEAPLTVNPTDIVWQNTLPADWMPIITRDTQRQRKQSSQPPFSDAYLSGMPSKRRKIIKSAKPPGNLSHVISNSMASALGSAGLGSGPEVEVVAQRASQDPTLRLAYREEVRTTLRSNLKTNPDFKPEKYPNAAKLFDNTK